MLTTEIIYMLLQSYAQQIQISEIQRKIASEADGFVLRCKIFSYFFGPKIPHYSIPAVKRKSLTLFFATPYAV